jgi:hypothetical protein
MTTLFDALVSQGYTGEEATMIISSMRNAVLEGEDPEEILYEFGLEPDYVFDLLVF